jgi:hypothetical protein
MEENMPQTRVEMPSLVRHYMGEVATAALAVAIVGAIAWYAFGFNVLTNWFFWLGECVLAIAAYKRVQRERKKGNRES